MYKHLKCEDKDDQLQINYTILPLLINSLIIDDKLENLMELYEEGADFEHVD